MKLEAMSVSFQYDNGNRKMLNNVSTSLESGKRAGLIAPSGSGKTTLREILAGYEKLDHEAVVSDGKNTSSCADYNPVQMIWQHPELSVNLRLKIREVLREEDFVGEWMVYGLGIEPDQLNRYPGELSGEELQRFCIARALGKRTRFTPADEINTTLDLITQSQVRGSLLEEVKTRDLDLPVVSYSEGLLERVCDRAADLRTD